MITATRVQHTVWCDDCDGPSTPTYCAMMDERTCTACHDWLECPCQDEEG